MKTPRNRTEACPIEELMDILAGRWKVFILWELIQGPRRSGELRKSIPPITQKVFVEQLRDLEDNGLVKRTVFPTVPPRVEYEATPLGHSLRYPKGDVSLVVREHGKGSRVSADAAVGIGHRAPDCRA
jgi:DNA-binding HxlR family transcriptional regulator